LGYFLLKSIYYIFNVIGVFETWFIVGILRFRKWLNVDVLDFRIELQCIYFGILLGSKLFWLLFEQFGEFTLIVLVTLLATDKHSLIAFNSIL